MSAVYPALCLWHLGMVSKHLPVLLVAVILRSRGPPVRPGMLAGHGSRRRYRATMRCNTALFIAHISPRHGTH